MQSGFTFQMTERSIVPTTVKICFLLTIATDRVFIIDSGWSEQVLLPNMLLNKMHQKMSPLKI